MINIVVVFPKLEDGKNIRNLLVRNGYQVAGVCTSGSQALQFADRLGEGIVVCGYKATDMIYSELHDCLPATFRMLLVASQHLLDGCADCDIVCLSLPLRVGDLVNTLEMILGSMDRRRRRKRSGPRERSEGEKKVIEEAKRLLMERNHMTEEEAHRYIQKCSMDSGNSLVETAKMVFSLMKF